MKYDEEMTDIERNLHYTLCDLVGMDKVQKGIHSDLLESIHDWFHPRDTMCDALSSGPDGELVNTIEDIKI